MRTAGLLSGLLHAGLLLGFLASGSLAPAAMPQRVLELTVPGVEGKVTCMGGPQVTRNGATTSKWQWHYLPRSFRLEEATQSNGKKLPALVLVRYPTKDPKNPGWVREGALLRFTLDLGLPEAALTKLKREIAKQVTVPGRALTENDILLDLAGSWEPCLTLLTEAGKVVVAGAKQVPTWTPQLGRRVTLEARINPMEEDLAKLLCTPGRRGLRLQLALTYLHPSQGKWLPKEFSVEGTLSLGPWPRATQEACITSLQEGEQFLYYTLPELGSSEQLAQSGVAQVSLMVGVLDRDGKPVGAPLGTVMAKAMDGFLWRNAKGEPLGLLGLPVPTAALRAKYGPNMASMTYQSRFVIGLEDPPRRFESETRIPLLSGVDPFSKPQLGAWMILFNAEDVTFYGERFPESKAVPEALQGQVSELVSLRARLTLATRDPRTGVAKQQPFNAVISRAKPTVVLVMGPGDGEHPVVDATIAIQNKIGTTPAVIKFSSVLEEGIRTVRLTDADWLPAVDASSFLVLK